MVSGNDKVAKPRINNAIGALSDPRIETLTRVSINVVKDVIPHARNNNDSYRLLNGKYPDVIHLEPSKIKRQILASALP